MRSVRKVVAAVATSDGAGVKLSRSLGTRELPDLDPFLMLDEIGSDDPGDYQMGFPDHPHRGFETVSYLLAGKMLHADSRGNRGLLGPGDVQWMTAGSGIVHSEMPQQEDGRLWGFQLWINLPRAHKMDPPRYQDLPSDRIPEVEGDGSVVRVLAGSFGGAVGPILGVATEPTMLDVRLTGGTVTLPAPEGQTAFGYVYEGSVTLGADRVLVPQRHLAVFGPGNGIEVSGEGRLLVLCATPLREPVARYGPFVMSTRAELATAFEDWQAGRLG